MPAVIDERERRPAAVTLAILAEPPHGVVFIERAAHLANHPGQIGLPGGALDPSDGGDHRAAALRELHEEVGIGPERVSVVGELPMIAQRVNVFDVVPFVAVVEPGPLRIDPNEVASVFTVPLATILGDALTTGHVRVGAVDVPSDILDVDGRRIWGLTGRILRSFRDAWKAGDGDMRARVERALATNGSATRPAGVYPTMSTTIDDLRSAGSGRVTLATTGGTFSGFLLADKLGERVQFALLSDTPDGSPADALCVPVDTITGVQKH